ncbi:MAG TPA: hypothetical protein VEU06_08380 [Micropepsaceae bacterium]|nr:hypothetical protein [Micropepsaceae bacterium]
MREAATACHERPRLRKKPSGWSPERRARQSMAIRAWRPWTRSTGPRTAAGKAKTAMNAYKHGARSRRFREELRAVRSALRRCRESARIAANYVKTLGGKQKVSWPSKASAKKCVIPHAPMCHGPRKRATQPRRVCAANEFLARGMAGLNPA